ncbi:cysteine synthase A [Haloarcula amylovorans]|uniref:cysteine synthase A n=1 Tax=Haloarcula amylovorans TaxID=2562280 RepID=UPI0010760001|nr:cysteine synthase A [Halomicroarcula amylolytica]
MNVASDVTELVGETPLLRLDAFAPNLLGKVEAANPGGSVKDRIAVAMLERAREAGHLEPGGTVVEPTSGNTGIGLAVAAAAEGYDLVLTMPESMSEERRALLRALGADLVLTSADGGMAEAIESAEAIADERENSFVPQQFTNLANPRIHRETTGPEIWRATDGAVDAVVAGVGTGGTITGVSAALKEDRDADVRSIAVEPADSAVLSGGEPGSHSVQGIGAGFVPEVLRIELLDEVHTVESDEAAAAARQLASEQGLLVGISSGAAIAAAERVATDAPDEAVVVVLPDTGERYLSTELFA